VEAARGEMVERELDAMIERRSRKGEVDPEEREELWKAGVRAYNARRKEENRRAWCEYFEHIAFSLRERAAEYDQRAQILMEDEPRGAA
jgi:thiamine monophosphate synthase